MKALSRLEVVHSDGMAVFHCHSVCIDCAGLNRMEGRGRWVDEMCGIVVTCNIEAMDDGKDIRGSCGRGRSCQL